MLNDEQLKTLLEVAEKATQGEWQLTGEADYAYGVLLPITDSEGKHFAVARRGDATNWEAFNEAARKGFPRGRQGAC